MAHYLDTSAAVKLVVAEPESDALRAWLVDTDAELVSGDLLRTELLRAVRRGASDHVSGARTLLEAVSLMSMPTPIFERAATIEPADVRSLDALHLAAALELGDDLDGIITYDDGLTDAAMALGVTVVAPV